MSSHCFFNEILLFCFPNFPSLYSWDITLPPPFSVTVLSSLHFSLVSSSWNTRIQTWPSLLRTPPHGSSRDGPGSGGVGVPSLIFKKLETERDPGSLFPYWVKFLAGTFPTRWQGRAGVGRQRWVGNLEMEDKKSWPNPNFWKKAVSVPVAQILNSWMRCLLSSY